MARLRLGNFEVELWRGLANIQGLALKTPPTPIEDPCCCSSTFLSLLNFHVENIVVFQNFSHFQSFMGSFEE